MSACACLLGQPELGLLPSGLRLRARLGLTSSVSESGGAREEAKETNRKDQECAPQCHLGECKSTPVYPAAGKQNTSSLDGQALPDRLTDTDHE